MCIQDEIDQHEFDVFRRDWYEQRLRDNTNPYATTFLRASYHEAKQATTRPYQRYDDYTDYEQDND